MLMKKALIVCMVLAAITSCIPLQAHIAFAVRYEREDSQPIIMLGDYYDDQNVADYQEESASLVSLLNQHELTILLGYPANPEVRKQLSTEIHESSTPVPQLWIIGNEMMKSEQCESVVCTEIMYDYELFLQKLNTYHYSLKNGEEPEAPDELSGTLHNALVNTQIQAANKHGLVFCDEESICQKMFDLVDHVASMENPEIKNSEVDLTQLLSQECTLSMSKAELNVINCMHECIVARYSFIQADLICHQIQQSPKSVVVCHSTKVVCTTAQQLEQLGYNATAYANMEQLQAARELFGLENPTEHDENNMSTSFRGAQRLTLQQIEQLILEEPEINGFASAE